MEFVTAAQVRAYLDLEGTTGKYADAVITSNIRAASAFLQRETGRQFEAQTNTTKRFTTEGRAYMTIPDLRTVTSVQVQGATLSVDESYHLIPDIHHGTTFTSVQFRAFGSDYRGNPQWFDRNLDQAWWRSGAYSSLPNDLVITGDWGWDPLPDELLHATKVLAAFYTKRPASVLSDSQVTPEGAELRYSQLPIEVRTFIDGWKVGPQMVAI